MEHIEIPYNDAGQRAFEVIKKIAERICETGQKAMDDFIGENFPGAKTISERCDSGKYLRTVKTTDKRRLVIAYDYRAKTVETIQAVAK